MTGKERILKTLRFEEPDRPPHFEVMFELEKEAFGMQFPDRNEWGSATAAAKEKLVGTCMDIYQRIVERYKWDGLAVYWPWSDPTGVVAATVIVMKRGMATGYAGVQNPLFFLDNTRMLFGDAGDTLDEVFKVL